MDRASKEESLGQIKESFANVASVVLVEYAGVTVPVVTTIRDEFRKAGCHYRVLKNSLVKIAVKGSKMEPLTKLLKGPTAVIWTDGEPQVPAKIAMKWAKEQPKFIVKGGYFDGQLLDTPGVQGLASMPGKPEAQGMLLMQFLAAPQNFVYLLDARKRQLEGGGDAPAA